MQRFTDNRDDTTADELWVVEHDPVFTLGQAGKVEHVLAPGDIPAFSLVLPRAHRRRPLVGPLCDWIVAQDWGQDIPLS